uniref:Uncharacterized protein n=1 Tax=Panagrolaimus sp. JU765 TaxID=591449 RepID=A0AC34Q073_9BILA
MLESPEFVEEYSGIPIQIYKSAFFEPEKIQTTRKLNFINSLKHFFVSVFLPQGYPHTVAEDYAEYQIWDTIQAFASSLNGALSTAAILKGAGVAEDYAEYQIWDTVQAFASSLNGALSTAAILKGAGVGDQEATVLAASLTWMDTIGFK